jgi:hypothetical protein
MKKLTMLIVMIFGYFTNANAFDGVQGFNIGVSLSAGVFDVDGAKEEFKGAHVGAASPGDILKNASEDDAEGLYAIGSIFAEVKVTDELAFGLDYVPHSLDTETTENAQSELGTAQNNTVQVDFENLATLYATVQVPALDGLYAKVGYVQVDVITNEVLGTGGAYGDTELDGFTVGIGYQRDVQNDTFVRVEANYMELDGATLTNQNDSTKSVTADGITGYGARLSIGKSF